MVKNLRVLVVIIVVVTLISGISGYLYATGYFADDDREDPPPPRTNEPPKAVLMFLNGTIGRVGDRIWFDGSNSSDPDPDDQITRFEWDFGDGGRDSTTNATPVNYTYLSPGTWDVNLTVYDKFLGKDSMVKPITIRQNDITIENSAILLSREPGGFPSEVNVSFAVDSGVVSLTINVSFQGAAWGDSTITDTVIEVMVFDSLDLLIANKTETSGIQGKTVDFYLEPSELTNTGSYEVIAKCTEGSLMLDYKIEILY